MSAVHPRILPRLGRMVGFCGGCGQESAPTSRRDIAQEWLDDHACVLADVRAWLEARNGRCGMRPRLLDLFAGAGGCSVGYDHAGFDVTGVDIEGHPDYPFELIEADALTVLADVDYLDTFDAVHASPPCQHYSVATANRDKHPDLVPPVRAALEAWGGMYVIENVPGAPLIDPVRICGSAFPELGVRRHRLFESNVTLTGTGCHHASQGQPVGVYGDHPDSRRYLRPNGTQRGTKALSLTEGQAAMGISWMTWRDLTEAIPPLFTAHIGAQLITHLAQEKAA